MKTEGSALRVLGVAGCGLARRYS